MLELHGHPASTATRRVRIALHEKQLDHRLHTVALERGEHKRADFIALNPYGRVPVLVDGDFVLYESAAILAYLEATHPHPALLPPTPQARASADMHMRLCDLQFARHTGVITAPKRFMPPSKWPREAMAAARAELQRHLDLLEGELAARPYLAGDTFSLADLCYLPYVDLLPLMEIEPPPAVGRWVERIVSRPSAQAHPLAAPPSRTDEGAAAPRVEDVRKP